MKTLSLLLLCLVFFYRGTVCKECSISVTDVDCMLTNDSNIMIDFSLNSDRTYINFTRCCCNLSTSDNDLTCSCNTNGTACPSAPTTAPDPCPGYIAASVLVTPLLLTLLIGGIIAIVVLVKKKKQTKIFLFSVGNTIQKSRVARLFKNRTTDTSTFDNPTYNETTPSTQPRDETSTAAPRQPKRPVYDTVVLMEDSNAGTTVTDAEMNYDVIREEFDGFNHQYDSVFVETPYDNVFEETPYDTVSLGEPEVERKPPLTAYAVTSVDTNTISKESEGKKFSLKENFVMNRVKSFQGSTRPRDRRIRYAKKPVPRPKPKLNISITQPSQPAVVVAAEPRLVKSASVSHVDNYSHINPKTTTSYAELEPHINTQQQQQQQQGVKKTNSVDGRKPRSKDEYSHLNH